MVSPAVTKATLAFFAASIDRLLLFHLPALETYDVLADDLLQVVRRGIDQLGGVELPEHLVASLERGNGPGAQVLHPSQP